MKQEEIIERLEMIREGLSLNVTQFAEAAGISQGNMSAMLNNKRVIGEGVINKVCMELGVNKRYILTGEGNTFSDSIVTINDCDKLKYTENDNLKIHTEVIMSTINDRIQDVINVVTGGNASKFARMCDVSASIINSITGGRRSEPSFSILLRIYNAVMEKGLSAHWLLTGEGDMIDEPKETPNPFMLNELSDMINYLEDRVREKDDIISQRDKLISNLLNQFLNK